MIRVTLIFLDKIMIPKIIHQYWDGQLPEQYKKFSQNFQTLNREFKYILWNKNSVIEKCTQHCLYEHLYESDDPVTNSDIARIIILDIYGGLYFDSDMRPERSIPNDILNNNAFACYENEKTLGQTIANGAIGSEQNGSFINNLIKEICKINPKKIKRINKFNSWLILGPRLWTKKFFDCLDDQSIMIYPSWYFIPSHYWNISAKNNKKGFITTHIWHKKYENNSNSHILHYSHNKPTILIKSFKEIHDAQR